MGNKKSAGNGGFFIQTINALSIIRTYKYLLRTSNRR